ncbi:MAG: hypothetical protein ABIC19_00605 [Patescibacteria group bacterium]|nr:hypothetical protein [Patescibacteria group bacterium]
MEPLQNILSIVLSGISAIGVLFVVYHHFRNPDIRADKKLGINEATCDLKHKHIEEKFGVISEDLHDIKKNHLNHIEKDISGINEKMAGLSGQLNTMIELFKEQSKK